MFVDFLLHEIFTPIFIHDAHVKFITFTRSNITHYKLHFKETSLKLIIVSLFSLNKNYFSIIKYDKIVVGVKEDEEKLHSKALFNTLEVSLNFLTFHLKRGNFEVEGREATYVTSNIL